MKIDYQIDAEKVVAALRKAPKQIEDGINAGLLAAANVMVQAARENLRNNDSLTSSKLLNSIQHENTGHFERTIMPKADYAIYVEKGTRAGYKPPKLPLQSWLSMRGAAQPERAVYALQDHIFKVGTRAHPFWESAVDASVPTMRKVVYEHVKRAAGKVFG